MSTHLAPWQVSTISTDPNTSNITLDEYLKDNLNEVKSHDSSIQSLTTTVGDHTTELSTHDTNIQQLLQAGIKPQVSSQALLPTTGNQNGDIRFSLAEGAFFKWDNTKQTWTQTTGSGSTTTTTTGGGSASGGGANIADTVNVMRNSYRSMEAQNSSARTMLDMFVDAYNDATAIDTTFSSAYRLNGGNVQMAPGQQTYQTNTDWNKLTLAQTQALNNILELTPAAGSSQLTTTVFPGFNNLSSIAANNNNNNQVVAVDSNGTAHVAIATLRYNSTYDNIDYYTISPSGVISSVTSITTSTTSNSLRPAIALDSNNTSHIVFESQIYSANSYYNIGYVTVTSSGTVSGITWLTTSTTVHSYVPNIAVDSNNTSHVVFQSLIYNSGYWNIGYVTITSSGTASGITWLTTSTTASSVAPSVAVDSNSVSHIVFHSEIYNASYYNIAYIAVSSSGTVGSLIWLTTSTTVHSQYAMIAVESNGTSHVAFHSNIYSSAYVNVGYVTVSNSGTVSGITWLSTSTTTTGGQYPTIAVDPNGTSHVTFESYLFNASYWNIAYIQVNSAGVASPIAWLTTSTTAMTLYPSIAMNAGEAFIIALNSSFYPIFTNTSVGNTALMTMAENQTGWSGQQPKSVAVDTNGTAHVVTATKRYSGSYWNIDYFTINPSGVVSSPVSITASTAANSVSPSIAVDSNGVSHIVFHSTIYNASYYNIGYVTVTSSGTASSITWLTTSTSVHSEYPIIAIDSNGTSHVTFMSYLYTTSYWNIAYMTVTSSGTTSAITWLTTSTTVHSYNPAIAIDSNNTSHVTFMSEIYNASFWNVGYVTISSSGAASGITWLTTSTSTHSQYPTIAIDSNNTSHVTFMSLIYNATYYNIGYITVTSSGTVSGITWLTTSTTASSEYPSITVDANGASYITFQSQIYNSSYWNIGYVMVTSSGTVSSITWLTASTTASSTYPAIATNAGKLYVAAYSTPNNAPGYVFATTTTYNSSGTATGTIDAGTSVTWNNLTLAESLGGGTSVTIQYQTSNDNATWSSATTVTSGTALSGVTGRYLKFILTLSTSNPSNTPQITQLQVNWTNPQGTVVTTTITASTQPTKMIVDAEGTGAITYDVSLDGGKTWLTNVRLDSLLDVSSYTGTSIKARANIQSGASLQSLGVAWYDNTTLILSQSLDPAIGSMILDDTINTIKTNFRSAETRNVGKYTWKNFVIDAFNDASGIDSTNSTNYSISGGQVAQPSPANIAPLSNGGSAGSVGTVYAGSVNNAFNGSGTVIQTDGGLNGYVDFNSAPQFGMPGSNGGALIRTLANAQVMQTIKVQMPVNTTDTVYCKIDASNDNTNWTNVGAQQSFTGAGTFTFTINSSTAYQYWRIAVSDNANFPTVGAITMLPAANGNTTLITTADTPSTQPTKLVLDAEMTGSVTFDVSLDGGSTWLTNVTTDGFIDVSNKAGSSLKIRANIPSGASIQSLGYAWFDNTIGLTSSAIDPGTQTTITNLQINQLKTNFKVSALQNASKYGLKNMVIDDYNDTTGINTSASSGYQFDSSNKQMKLGAPVNIAKGITGYTYSVAPNSSYPDNSPTSKLTNGTTPSSPMSSSWVGISNSAEIITFDLKSPQIINDVKVEAGSNTSAGYYFPTSIQVKGSNDNATWTSIATQTFSSSNASYSGTGLSPNNFDVVLGTSTAYQYYQVTLGTSGSGMMLGQVWFNQNPANAVIVSTIDTASAAPSKVLLDAEYTLPSSSDTIKFELSMDGGTTFMQVQPDVLTTLTGIASGTQIVSRVTLTGNATITSLGYSWQ